METAKFKELINSSSKIYLASHINPDGDNIGSILGMYGILKKLGKEVYLIEDDIVPDTFKFLPFLSEIVRSDTLKNDADLFITLDSADVDRIGANAKVLFYGSKNTVNIDHHSTNTMYADVNIVDALAPATGEILFELAKNLNVKIDKNIALCIYTAISSDTGSFKYDNVRPSTFKIASELIKIGIDINKVAVNLYQNRSIEKTRLLISAMNNLELYSNGKIGIVYVDDIMIKNCNAQSSDTEGIVEFIRDISGVEIAILFKIKKDSIRISIRTKSYVDATKIVRSFDGGGHIRAAGATLKLPYFDRKEEIIKISLRELNERNINI
ncbi:MULTISPECIES: bifunctional oligoribonuclease/PAP phosphatase NrnA [Peptoniphilus]|uniref:DHH family phosphoesterase n=1 Tax=Peptoniphilus TaxID=162289 RepID=UPI0001DA9CEE|nr:MULTISPECIES: bifunctional oligoribonuclease/PAP phosphatase NrnA [Peptoniphilus]EFI42274.1 DHHA1 domain protein [Peptoniphilus sp. oral taxon 386 str. F0131]